MNRARFLAFVPVYQGLAGACDFTTGLLLIIAPAWTLRFMGLHQPVMSPELISFIGCFVAGVGLAYLVTAFPSRHTDYPSQIRTVWLVTALSRATVAVYLSCRIATGTMEPGWSIVALTDGVLATFQFTALRLGWLTPASEWK